MYFFIIYFVYFCCILVLKINLRIKKLNKIYIKGKVLNIQVIVICVRLFNIPLKYKI